MALRSIIIQISFKQCRNFKILSKSIKKSLNECFNNVLKSLKTSGKTLLILIQLVFIYTIKHSIVNGKINECKGGIRILIFVFKIYYFGIQFINVMRSFFEHRWLKWRIIILSFSFCKQIAQKFATHLRSNAWHKCNISKEK